MIDISASIDWYHAKDLHNTNQYLHNTHILIQCYIAFQIIFNAKITVHKLTFSFNFVLQPAANMLLVYHNYV